MSVVPARELAAWLGDHGKEPWMTIGARPFTAESAHVFEELADAMDRAVALCREAAHRLAIRQFRSDDDSLIAALDAFVDFAWAMGCEVVFDIGPAQGSDDTTNTGDKSCTP